jgi:uncharacterized protein
VSQDTVSLLPMSPKPPIRPEARPSLAGRAGDCPPGQPGPGRGHSETVTERELNEDGTTLSELERYDGGFFVACLCTPLLAPTWLASCRATAPPGCWPETHGDLALILPRWRTRAAAAVTDADRGALSRYVSRRLVGTGFTLIMPRWGGWSSDLNRSAMLFGRYYPQCAAQLRGAAAAARAPSADPAVLAMLIDDLGPWLAAEYTAVHGEKAPRP